MRADRPLHRAIAKLPPPLRTRASSGKHKTCRDLLQTTELELVDQLDLPLPDVRAVVKAVSIAVAGAPCTASQMLGDGGGGGTSAAGAASASASTAAIAAAATLDPFRLATGLPRFDAHLGGGLPASLCELVGPPGVGKTQLCLTVAARALIDGDAHGHRVLYVDTEGSFSASRLLQVIERLADGHSGFGGGVSRVPGLAERLLSRVTVFKPATWSQFTTCLYRQVDDELLRPSSAASGGGGRVALLVVDSVAMAMQRHFDLHLSAGGYAGKVGGGGGPDASTQKRQQTAGAHAAQLKLYASRYRLCVLCVNQVVDAGRGAFGPAGEGGRRGDVGAIQARDDGQVVAYMGTLWAHCVNLRLALQYPRFTSQLPAPPPPGVVARPVLEPALRPRKLRVAKAAFCEESEFDYAVGEEGCVEVAM